AATIIVVSGGYPEDFKKGFIIENIEEVKGSLVFHSGTAKDESGNIVTSGGRVLAITTLDQNFEKALKISKENADKIQYHGKYYRHDIGFDL
ncbi:MAG TPA: phosphoribosylglycinamide synthetase C domain-containing protein, partial [Saprospiraceae bacterium]|nr:phosphoribosylglycinamide synthetase C domain-containing protein [Saprospiraceae bacterium]